MTDRQKLQRNISRALYLRFFQAFMVLVPVAVPFLFQCMQLVNNYH